MLYHPHDRAAQGVASPDGVMLHSKPSPDRPADEPPAVPASDLQRCHQHLPTADGSFEMYCVALVSVPKSDPAYMAHDKRPGCCA